jgi:hypothetical protein
MMRIKVKNLNAPPSQETLDELVSLQEQWSFSLPKGYLDFITQHDGGHDDNGMRYLDFSKVSGLYFFDSWAEAPSFLIFASNGGGEVFCFKNDRNPNHIYMLPTVGSINDAIYVGADVEDLLNFEIHEALSKS